VRWFVIALLLLGMGGVLAQAPIVRRPPTTNGAQAPQSNEAEVPTIKVETRLVNVALNVVDAKGAPVGGLGREDFQILEDGTPQKIAICE
jgi:Ca-activated chloride channel family protein